MPGLGTVINVAAILLGGLGGLLFGRLISEGCQETLTRVCGVCVIFIGMGGALSGMLSVEGGTLSSGRSLLLAASLANAWYAQKITDLGELLDLETGIERFGGWLKIKTGSAGDRRFVEGFVTASLTVCIGAMAIIGAIQDGIFGDISILAAKAVLDCVIVMIMTCSLGKGCIFSALPVAAFQGTINVLARLIRPLMTDAALGNLSMVGSVLIFCVGVNLVWEKRVRVANLLPALVISAGLAFTPLAL